MAAVAKHTTTDELMAETEAAYVAGFVDGEGCLSLVRAKQLAEGQWKIEPRFSVYNANTTVILRIREMVGCGAIYPMKARGPGHRQGYVLQWNRAEMAWVLPQIRPYLCGKAAQADLLMQFIFRKGTPESDAELRDRITELNSLGVAEADAGPNCPVCGALVDRSHYARKTFCSQKCQQDAANLARKNGRRAGETRTCPKCGKEFETTVRSAVYCSANCRGAAHTDRKRKGEGMKPRDIDLTCEHCGQAFKSARPDAKFCSRRCGVAAWRAEQKRE